MVPIWFPYWNVEVLCLVALINPVTACVQVFHGADMDVVWLQRDLGLYLVGLFDTHQAAILLGSYARSLQGLLEKYCNLQTEKK